jgi:CubicO group peptidase (beta-lactamase class C family)
MSELHVPGVSIAVIHHRAIVWSGEYGIADVSRHTPVTRETLFEAASMTKPVFACTVMKLVEQGKLDLDRPLSEYLEERALPDQPSRSLITARMILSHTAGFPNWRKGEEERDGPLPVLSRPGSRFSYSGEGIFYLQRVIEKITGEPVAVLAKRTLFDAIGLAQTSYVWTGRMDSLLAAGHAADGKFLMKTKYTHANAAYTLYTTAREYAAFLVEILKKDRAAPYLLSHETVRAMLKHQVAVDARAPIGRPGRAKGSAVYWGLGWSINTTGEGDIIHHSGANRSGFRCFSQFSPGRGSGIVIMTNGIRGDDLWARLIASVGDL